MYGEILNLSGTILFLFIISNYLLMPQINKARDNNNQKKFKILHLLSVMINFVIIILSVTIIVLMNK